ncbi:MAG: hypothetical protein ACUVTL_05340 [Thermoproteota archaeon]
MDIAKTMAKELGKSLGASMVLIPQVMTQPSQPYHVFYNLSHMWQTYPC